MLTTETQGYHLQGKQLCVDNFASLSNKVYYYKKDLITLWGNFILPSEEPFFFFFFFWLLSWCAEVIEVAS